VPGISIDREKNTGYKEERSCNKRYRRTHIWDERGDSRYEKGNAQIEKLDQNKYWNDKDRLPVNSRRQLKQTRHYHCDQSGRDGVQERFPGVRKHNRRTWKIKG